MPIHECRVCGHPFFDGPLLRFANMPKAAQNLPDAAELATERGIEVIVCQCSGCGLVQLSNDPVPYYREVIRAAGVSSVLRDLKTRQFAAFVEQYALRGKKILEIGCGRGEFLDLLAPLDVAARGLEYSAAAVDACRHKGLDVAQGYVETADDTFPGAPYDAFLLLMFLEHMPQPNAALRGIYNNLAERAVGLVEVPSFDMVLRRKLFSEFIGDHLLYFTEATLCAALETNGFEVLDCREIRDEYVISAQVRKRPRLDIAHFREYEAKIKVQLEAYLARFPGRRTAVWGAGHQALAILAMTGAADRIRYVVDAAPFKQGRFTPATHLPIVPPETLDADPVEAVIVMAGGYSDEVATIVRERFGGRMKLAVLRDYGLEEIKT